MECGDGFVCQCFPILAAYLADNPEQTMIASCQRNLCYKCTVHRDAHGDLQKDADRHPQHTSDALEAQVLGHTSVLFKTQGLKPCGKPFWANLPHCDIFNCLTPNILHQLHKGVFKDHLLSWCTQLIEKRSGNISDVNSRYQHMPRHSELRHFLAGITNLRQSTANEHKEMQKVVIGVMARLVPDDVMPVIVATVDFIHYARLPSHTTTTLALLDNALERFHEHKHVFVKYGIRNHFNINKIHSMLHYSSSILSLGTADGYNTETPERLHIEFAKRAYKATNRNDFFSQMTEYLERRERVFKFDAYLCWAIPEYAERSSGLKREIREEPL
jgi:hypothetical protein